MSASEEGVVGRWVPVDGPGRAFIEFSADGDVFGNDGCNRFGGQRWRVEGDRIVCDGARISTMMFCEGVDTWLARAETFELTDATLETFTTDESPLPPLRRA